MIWFAPSFYRCGELLSFRRAVAKIRTLLTIRWRSVKARAGEFLITLNEQIHDKVQLSAEMFVGGQGSAGGISGAPIISDISGGVQVVGILTHASSAEIRGTGILVGPNLVLTAAHVVPAMEEKAQYLLRPPSEQHWVPAKLIYRGVDNDVAILERAGIHTSAVASVVLSNLGAALQGRFGGSGDLADLEQAISLLREAVASVPPGHPDRAAMLSNLAAGLRARFGGSGDLADLEQAISLLREAVASVPPGHPDRAAMLSNLAAGLRARFGGSGDLADLEQAISLLREAVASVPPGHPDRAAMLSNLAAGLRARFGGSGDLADLEQAISLLREAVASVPPGHPDRAAMLSNLAARNPRHGNLERRSTPGTAPPGQPPRLPPRRLTPAQQPRHRDHHQPAGQLRHARAGSQQRNNAIARQEAAGTRPAPVSDPGAILKERPPPEFCRYNTGSSVGNPTCPRGDLNPQGGEISPNRENFT